MFKINVPHPEQLFAFRHQDCTNIVCWRITKQGVDILCLPICDALRKWAGDHMEKFAESMKKSAQKRSGDDKICEVGEVVHVALKNEDRQRWIRVI